MKKLKNLCGAKALNRNEQKSILGGEGPDYVTCTSAGDCYCIDLNTGVSFCSSTDVTSSNVECWDCGQPYDC